MAGTAPRIEGDSSNATRQQRVIECSPSVLQEIRTAVLDRFNRLPHGGNEIFGVLFGTHDNGHVQIVAFRPLPGEAGLSTSASLGKVDRASYAAVIASARNGGDAAALEPVGCFRAHPRSDLVLSERDLEIFHSLFAAPWQVSMIVRPGNRAPSRIRIFFRDADGTLRTDGGFRELIQAAFDQTLAGAESLELGDMSPEVQPREHVPEHGSALAPDRAMDQILDGQTPDGQTMDSGWHAALAMADQSPPVALEEMPGVGTPGVEPRKKIGVGTILWPSVLIAAALVAMVLYWMGRPQQLGLRVLDASGQVRISWDRDARAVRGGEGAHLEITDGNSKVWLELDRDQLRQANVTYPARSNSVTVRMIVRKRGAQPVEEMARFVSASSANQRWQPEAPAPEKPQELVVTVPVEPVTEPSQPAAAGLPLPPATAQTGRTGPEASPPAAIEARNTPAAGLPQAQRPAPSPVDRPAPARPTTAENNAGSTGTSPVAEGNSVPHLPAAPAVTQNAALNPAPTALAPPSTAQTAVSLPAAPNPATQSAVPHTPTPNPPTPPQAVENAAARAPHPSAAPASGRIIWIGRLQKNEVLTITGKSATTGSLMGELPGRPVKVSVSPGDLSNDGVVLYTSNLQYANSVVEPPSAQNGWNKTVYSWNPRLANDVIIQETPGQQNEWNRISLRSKNPKISVLVIEWALVN